eukprot:gene2610-1900_t
MLYGVINFATFLTGVLFGILIAGVALFHFLVSTKPKDKAEEPLPFEKDDHSKEAELPIGLTQDDLDRLNSIIDYLDEVSSPLKSMGAILQKIHNNKDVETSAIDTKMKTIVDLVTLSKLEKEHQDNIAELKDHSKQIKLLASFLNDTSRAVSSFSKDLTKLAGTAKSNMHRNSVIETKEDMIVNAWWQSLQISMDHLASDQEELATMVSEQLQNVSQQLQEEISLIEKRLNSEGNRYFTALRENIQLFEAKLRERDKCKEKMRTASIAGTAASLLTSASEQHQKRQLKLKQAEESLVMQTRKLYEAQRDFYLLMPRIASDVQLTVLKSIIETQSQLMKLADGIERAQGNSRNVCRRLRAQLTNAAGSLVQMINSDSRLLPDAASSGAGDSDAFIAGSSSMALEVMRQRQADRNRERGVKGFEMSLQRVLEGLLLQAQAKREPAQITATATAASAAEAEELGKLDMFAETTACLAANNPTLLPELPRHFGSHAIGLETCVWFNAFCGRVYRDMAESAYFNTWFRAKLAAMLNKGKRPGYVDAFEISSVKFGDQPPLLLNFTVATRFWLNWPRDRYASVPIFIHLDLSELQGRVRFGVKRSHSFLSFLKDPLTRISVRSEVGSDRLKLRDIPQVSDFIVRKLKSFIHRKIVHPHCHKFRLIWPRNWWPAGTENLFTSTTTVPGGVSDGAALLPPVSAGSKKEGAEAAVQTEIMAVGMSDGEVDDMMRETFGGPASFSAFGLSAGPAAPPGASSRRPSVAPLPTAQVLAGASPSQKSTGAAAVAAVDSADVAARRAERARSMSISASLPPAAAPASPETQPLVAQPAAAPAAGAVAVATTEALSIAAPDAAAARSGAASASAASGGSVATTPVKPSAAAAQQQQQQQLEWQWRGHLRRVSDRLQQQHQQRQRQRQQLYDEQFSPRLAETLLDDAQPGDPSAARVSAVQRDIAAALSSSPSALLEPTATHAAAASTAAAAAAATVAPVVVDERVAALQTRQCYRKYQDQRQQQQCSLVSSRAEHEELLEASQHDSAGYSLFLHQTILHPQRRPRAMSLSDFRPEVAAALLEDVLEHKDLSLPGDDSDAADLGASGHGAALDDDEAEQNRGKLLVGFRRARRPAPAAASSGGAARRQTTVDGRGAAQRSRAAPSSDAAPRGRQRTSTLTGAEYGYLPPRSVSLLQPSPSAQQAQRARQRPRGAEADEEEAPSDLDAAPAG